MSDNGHEPRMTGTKTCTHCHHTLPVLHFSVRRASLDGLADWCRGCEAEAAKHTPSGRRRRDESAARKTVRAKAFHNLYSAHSEKA